MASRAFYQTTQSLVQRLTIIQGSFDVGASGAVSNLKGSGVLAVTRIEAGAYEVQLEDSYNKLLAAHFASREAAGTAIAMHASGTPLTVGVLYAIVTLGTTPAADWVTVGVPAGVTPAVGVTFVAATTGTGSGTGTVAPVAATATADAQVVNLFGDPQTTINTSTPPNASNGAKGGYFCVVVRSGVGVVTDPPSGSRMFFDLLLRNSSIKGQGEA